MFTVLIINQKGGVGKTTIADELAFALERREYKTVYVSTDPQGGAVHEQPEDFSEIAQIFKSLIQQAYCLTASVSGVSMRI